MEGDALEVEYVADTTTSGHHHYDSPPVWSAFVGKIEPRYVNWYTSACSHITIEKMLDHKKGPITRRKYLIRWKDYWDNWVPRSNLHPERIRDYEMDTGSYVHTWPHLCPQCDLSCASERGIHIHTSKTHSMNVEKPQVFKGRLADEDVKKQKLVEQQKQRVLVLPFAFCLVDRQTAL